MKERKEIKTKQIDESTIFAIHLKDEETYYIRSSNIELAKELAMEWFSERKPQIDIKVVVDNDIYEGEMEE